MCSHQYHQLVQAEHSVYPVKYRDTWYLCPLGNTDIARSRAPRSQSVLAPVGGDRSPTNSYLEGLFRLGGGTVGGYNLFWLSPGDRPVTIDGRSRTSLVVDPVNGRVPPMKPEAQQRMAALLASRARPDAGESDAGGPSSQYDAADRRPLAERCILGFGSTSGPPTLPNYFYNNLKFIVQTRDWVMIDNEMVHDTRMIPIGGDHLPPHVDQWMAARLVIGRAIRWWSRPPTSPTRLVSAARGKNLKVTEQFTLAEDGTILYRFTVGGPIDLGARVDGRVPLEPEPRRDLRVRLPRGQLCAGNRASRRSTRRCEGG